MIRCEFCVCQIKRRGTLVSSDDFPSSYFCSDSCVNAYRSVIKDTLKKAVEAGIWGIFDTQDKVWIGDVEGPRLYEGSYAESEADISSKIICKQLGLPAGRLRVFPYIDKADKLVDNKTVLVSAEEAVRILEESLVI